MAKTNGNNVYTWTWFDISNSDLEFKLELQPSDTIPISPVIVSMDIRDLDSVLYSYSWDKYYIGIPSEVPKMEITFDLNRTGGAFNQIIMYPYIDITSSINFTAGLDISLTYNYSVTLTNMLTLSVKNHNAGVPAWKVIFKGAQKNGLDNEYDPGDGTFKVVFQDLVKYVYENTSTESLRQLYRKGGSLSSGIFSDHDVAYDWIFKIDQGDWAGTQIAGMFQLLSSVSAAWLFPISAMEDHLTDLATAIDIDIQRKNVTTNFSYPKPSPISNTGYYKQRYNISDPPLADDGGISAEITSLDDLYIVGLLTLISGSNKSSLDESSHIRGGWFDGVLQQDYPKLWDLYFDLVRENLNIAWFDYTYSGGDGISVFNQRMFDSTAMSWSNTIPVISDIEFSTDNLQRSQASASETVGDDLSTVEFSSGSSRNDNSMEITILNNTAPPVAYNSKNAHRINGARDYWQIQSKLNLTDTLYFTVGDGVYDFHLQTLYYLERPSLGGGFFTTEDVPIRVHEHVTFRLDSVVTSDTILTDTSSYPDNIVFQPGTLIKNQVYQKPLEVQSNRSKQWIVANVTRRLFNGEDLSAPSETQQKGHQLKGMATIGDGFESTTNASIWFSPTSFHIEYDPSNLSPIKDNTRFQSLRKEGETFAEYYVLDCTVDLIKSDVDFIMKNRTSF